MERFHPWCDHKRGCILDWEAARIDDYGLPEQQQQQHKLGGDRRERLDPHRDLSLQKHDQVSFVSRLSIIDIQGRTPRSMQDMPWPCGLKVFASRTASKRALPRPSGGRVLHLWRGRPPCEALPLSPKVKDSNSNSNNNKEKQVDIFFEMRRWGRPAARDQRRTLTT